MKKRESTLLPRARRLIYKFHRFLLEFVQDFTGVGYFQGEQEQSFTAAPDKLGNLTVLSCRSDQFQAYVPNIIPGDVNLFVLIYISFVRFQAETSLKRVSACTRSFTAMQMWSIFSSAIILDPYRPHPF